MIAIPFSKRRIILGVLFVSLFIFLTILGAKYLPPGVDWRSVLRPGCLAILRGESPYQALPYLGFPPWSLIPLIPLALIPESIGRAILFLIGVLVFAYAIYKLGARPIAMIAFLLSPPVIHSLLNANLDWMPLLGFVLPPQIGLFLVSTKPQMSSVVILFWLVEAWRKDGILEVMYMFGPIILVSLISFAIYGFWPMHYSDIYGVSQGWNASLWPASIPVGLGLLVSSIRLREVRFAMAASPCLSPYVLLHAWSGALATLAPLTLEMIATVVGLWILAFIQVGPPFLQWHLLSL